MTDILRQLADAASERVAHSSVSREEMRRAAEAMGSDTGFPFEAALRRSGVSFICEVKKASPSKGVICEDFDPVAIAREYDSAGADCISVLTEPTRFLGDVSYLREISGVVSCPLLRKDFIVDDYMIYEAKVCGASAVLLIVSILNDDELRRFISLCDRLGMSALVEVHGQEELERALSCGARVVGINNRDLRDFSVDLGNSVALGAGVPDDIVLVAESGISTHGDVMRMASAGADAVLVGEALMRSDDKAATLGELRYGE
ncbi:MAG: indole-3-glycerol phosphate synthase TrpC [Candidatus Methanomethylophilaceae archaeon]|nr:indole-3-glycerol phosphate synthase TrpC [Candidatus Methanomethylophilaceae archaeon]